MTLRDDARYFRAKALGDARRGYPAPPDREDYDHAAAVCPTCEGEGWVIKDVADYHSEYEVARALTCSCDCHEED